MGTLDVWTVDVRTLDVWTVVVETIDVRLTGMHWTYGPERGAHGFERIDVRSLARRPVRPPHV